MAELAGITGTPLTLGDSADLAISQILDAYLIGLEQGTPGDPADILRDHPHLAEKLRPALAKLAELHYAAAALPADSRGGNAISGKGVPTGVLGEFRIVREIGRGGMGIVYEAEQISLRRRVALKTLPFAALFDARRLARFKNEAQAAAQLHHPHIVPVHAIGVDRDIHYYAMQYVDGQTLAELIHELRHERKLLVEPPIQSQAPAAAEATTANETVGLAEDPTATSEIAARQRPDFVRLANSDYFRHVARLITQAAQALDYAHHHGILHRDVKPANLMLDRDGELWVTDFGLARIRQSVPATVTGERIGTLRYMSPEQAAGSKLLDERTDVYSLGATLYELLTLQPIFVDDDSQKLLHAVLHESPARPRKLEPHVPRDLETIVLKATAKDRSERYGSAAELAADLERFVDRRPVRARRSPLSQRTARWAARNPAIASLMLLVAFSALVIGMGAVWYQGRLDIAATRVKSADDARNAERYFTLRTDAHRLEAERPGGWTQSALDKLAEAARLPAAQHDRETLRTEAVAILCAPDFVHTATLYHGTTVFCLAYSPDGKRLAVASNLEEGQVPVQIWDPIAGELLETRHFPADPNYVTTSGRHGDGARSIAYSRDGRYLAVGSRSGWLHVWDQSVDPPALTSWFAHSKPVLCAIFGKTNHELFTGGEDGWLTLWNIETREELRSKRFTSPVRHLSISRSYRAILASLGGFDHAVVKLKYRDFNDIATKAPTTDVSSPAIINPSDTFSVVTTSTGRLQFLDDLGNPTLSLPVDRAGPAHKGAIEHLDFSPECGMLASSCSQDELKVWNVMTGELVWRRGFFNGANIHAKFDPLGNQLAVTADQETHIYRIGGYPCRHPQAQGVATIIAFDANLRYKSILTLESRNDADSYMTARYWKYSRNNNRLEDSLHTVWSAHQNAISLAGQGKGRLALPFDGVLNVEDFRRPHATYRFPSLETVDLKYEMGADELWAACARQLPGNSAKVGGICGWSLKDGASVGEWFNTDPASGSQVSEIRCLDVGNNLVVGGSHDESVKVLQRRPFKLLRSIVSPAGRIRSIAMTKKEQLVLAGTDQGALLVIQPADGKVLDSVKAHAESIETIAVSHDEGLVVTGAADGTLRVWRSTEGSVAPLFSLPKQRNSLIRAEFVARTHNLLTLATGDTALQAWNLKHIQAELGRRGLN
jgi:serine/threonine protein kinase/WD40 repeat protein